MRQFLAIPLPDSARHDAAGLPRVLRLPPEQWRFVRAEGLHVTIRFLGEVDSAHHLRLDDAWRAAAEGVGPLSLRVGGASFAPSAERPRIVCLRVHDATCDGALGRLAARIEQAARSCGVPPEERPFAAHVTLARARRGARVATADLSAVVELASFIADRLVLYHSRLGSGGAVYDELASYPLEPKGAS